MTITMNEILLILVTVTPIDKRSVKDYFRFNFHVFWTTGNTFYSLTQTFTGSQPFTTVVSGDINDPNSAKTIYSENISGFRVLALILANKLNPKIPKFTNQRISIQVSIVNYDLTIKNFLLKTFIDLIVQNLIKKGSYLLSPKSKLINAERETNINKLESYKTTSDPEPKISETSYSIFAPAILSPKNTNEAQTEARVIPLQNARSPFQNIHTEKPNDSLITQLDVQDKASHMKIINYQLSTTSLRSQILELAKKYMELKSELPESHQERAISIFPNPLWFTRAGLSTCLINYHPIKFKAPKPRKQRTSEGVEHLNQETHLSARIFSLIPYLSKVFRYDCNALYSFIYTFPIPLSGLIADSTRNVLLDSDPQWEKAKGLPKLSKQDHEKTRAVYVRIKVNFREDLHPLDLRQIPTSTPYYIITTIQEAIALSKYADVDVTIDEVYNTTKIKVYSLEEMVKLKETITKQQDKSLATFIKDKLNIWWGKTAASPKPILTPSYDPDQGLMKSTQPPTLNPKLYIGIHITSWARTYMLAFLLSPKYRNNIIYHDTDSLFTTTPLTSDWPNQDILKILPDSHQKYLKSEVKKNNGWVHPSQLGLFKKEGELEEIVALGIKTYLTKSQHQVKLTIAGLHPTLHQLILKYGLSLHLFQLLKELIYWVHYFQLNTISLVLQSNNSELPQRVFTLAISYYHSLNESELENILKELTPSQSHFTVEESILKAHWEPQPIVNVEELRHHFTSDIAFTYSIEEKSLTRLSLSLVPDIPFLHDISLFSSVTQSGTPLTYSSPVHTYDDD